jgi:transcriptional regulator with XRE-family HTH domain
MQRSELALQLKPLIEAKAKEKQKESGGAVIRKSGEPPIRTDKELAKIAGVSHDTISKVEKIKESASPELLAAARAGEVSIAAAADLARLPFKEQRGLVYKSNWQ